MNKRCLNPECSAELINVNKTRVYCDNRNRCKNAHSYQKIKLEKEKLKLFQELENKKENCINILNQILTNKLEETLDFETLKLTGVDLADSYIDLIKADDSTYFFRFKEFELIYSVEQDMITIKRID